MKHLFTLALLTCSLLFCHAETFVDNDIAYQVNSDGTSVSVTYIKDTGWNWKSWNNYEDETIVIPETVSNGDVTYPVTAIGTCAFSNSHKLTTVILPSTIRRIESYAFANCDNLSVLELPNGLEEIATWAFFNCHLDKLVIPPSLKKVESAAFYSEISGGGASNVYISDLSAWLKIDFGQEGNPTRSHFYLNNEPIAQLIIPDDIEDVKRCALMNIDCEEIIVPDHVSSIGEYAFYGCKAQYIKIGEGVKEINSWALSYCNYQTIELGSSVETIYSPNFNNIPNLTTIITHAPQPPTLGTRTGAYQIFTYFHGRDDDEDDYNLSTKTLVVPKGAKDAYSNATKWKEFGHIMEEGDEEPTHITAVQDNSNPTPLYDLQGRIVNHPRERSLYIKNGKVILF